MDSAVEQMSGTTSGDAPAQPLNEAPPSPPLAAGAVADQSGFGARGRLRRRVRFLRKARELAYRDLGGLVFNLHRFGQRNDALVLAKLNLLGHIDDELRSLEDALAERRPITVLREAGITACARCAAIHASDDRFCPNCGLSLGRHPDLPIAVAATAATPASAPPAPGAVATGAPTGAVSPTPGPPAPSASPPAVPATGPAATPPSPPATQIPVTQAFPAVADGGDGSDTAGNERGRSPAPPVRAPSPAPGSGSAAPGDGAGSITEVIRPPGQGS
jgi:hypothetical protein